MNHLAQSSTNEDSIRPVSSLRSLFENKSGTSSISVPDASSAASKHSARLDHAQQHVQVFTRTSLDIPRGASPWLPVDSAPIIQRNRTPGPPLPLPRQPSGRSLQRPLSTTSLSASPSPPTVTIVSPNSPPKHLVNSKLQNSTPSGASRPAPARTVISDLSHTSPVHPLRSGRSISGDPPNFREEDRSRSHNRVVSKAVRVNRFAPSNRHNAPPLVNRAHKPKIPSKSVAAAHKAKLEPFPPEVEERVSPFSTPPSSDDGVRPFTPTAHEQNESGDLHAAILQTGHPRVRLPSIHRSINNEICSEELISLEQIPRPDARKLGFALPTDSLNTVIEERPNLPPRRDQSQRTGADRQAIDPTGKNHGIISRTPPRGPSIISAKQSKAPVKPVAEFLPPPKRSLTPHISSYIDMQGGSYPGIGERTNDSSSRPDTNGLNPIEPESSNQASVSSDYPDASNVNRRPPYCKQGMQGIEAIYDARIADICGPYVATTGHVTKVWNLMTGETVLMIGHAEKETRITAMAFKPGGKVSEEGSRLWLGSNHGELQEIDISTQSVVKVKSGAHERREIVKIHRQQSSMWTLDDGGKFCIWLGDDAGLPDLHRTPSSQRVPKGHTFSIVVHDTLWLATGKDIRVYRPNACESASFLVTPNTLNESSVGIITSGAVVSGQLDRVYFGHVDGKVTIYSTENFSCLAVVIVSAYKICTLAGAGFHLWAGYSTGTVLVYDTRTRPWTTKKEWRAHSNPVLDISIDRSSLWQGGVLRVMSLGGDNTLKMWDGTLEDDWLVNDMQDRDIEYCTFREITALVVTWNAGAATPAHLRHEENDPRFFETILGSSAPPDILVFGFQELVDLEDKKLTARTLLKGSKKKDPQDQEHMSRQYRAWRDYLIKCIDDAMPAEESYQLLHTASMVGLFSCVFTRASQRSRIRNVNAAEIKRGMGGLHGNKGALILRFVIDDSSMCFVNCHLAAGQTQTAHRNNDLTAILESAVLPADKFSMTSHDPYVGGGDGSMILDNEICILNGDLNYRIDTMGRDTVVKAVGANNLAKLIERDQLLVSRRRNPALRIRAFKECPLTFAPTYKYDVGSDSYDTSEKRRAPAWCDRILYRGAGKVKQIDYRRHELRVSDHRPVSGVFRMRIKTISAEKRAQVWKDSEIRFYKAKERLATEAKIQYLRDVLGVPPAEAKRLL